MNKKELLLNAALELFVKYGFHGTATSKIAKEAGVANGTLFQYFNTKDELVTALYINLKDELAETIQKNTLDNAEFKETLKSQVLSTLYWALEHPQKFKFIQQFHTSPYIAKVEPHELNNQAEPHLRLIQSGIDDGILKPLPANLIYSLISSQIFGLHQYITTQSLTRSEQDVTIEIAFDMLWNMMV